jgi:uncharacterized membrane protein YbhN (UPF0104 family)
MDRRLRLALQVAVAAALLGWLAATSGWEELWRALASAPPALCVLLLGMYYVGVALSCWKWSVLLHVEGLHVPFIRLFRWYLIGVFAGNYLPTEIGGDLGRGLVAGRATGQPLSVARSILAERLSGLAVLIALALAGVATLLGQPALAAVGLALGLVGAGLGLAAARAASTTFWKSAGSCDDRRPTTDDSQAGRGRSSVVRRLSSRTQHGLPDGTTSGSLVVPEAIAEGRAEAKRQGLTAIVSSHPRVTNSIAEDKRPMSLPPSIARLFARLPARLRAALADTAAAAPSYLGRPGALTLVAVISVAFQLLAGVGAWLNLWATGARLPLAPTILAAAIAGVAGMLPITLNGWGVREGIFVALLTPFGAAPGAILAGALLGRGLNLLATLPGGVLLMLEGRADVAPPAPSGKL